MLTITSLSDKPCFMCGKNNETVEARMKDGTFKGVLCFDHLKAVLKRGSKKEPEKTEAK